MLFNEPKLLKYVDAELVLDDERGFSALQRAEIAEIVVVVAQVTRVRRFSALQRAEIAEILRHHNRVSALTSFSALQRAEIAEIRRRWRGSGRGE